LDEGFLEKCEDFEAATTSPMESRRLYRRTFDRIAEVRGVLGRHSLRLQPRLECLLRVRVYNGRPYSPEIMLPRVLPEVAAGAQSPDSGGIGSTVA